MEDKVELRIEVNKETAEFLRERWKTFCAGVGKFVPFPEWLNTYYNGFME